MDTGLLYVLSAVYGGLMSLAFTYIPGLNSKFAQLQDEKKQLVMLGFMLGGAALVVALSCIPVGGSPLYEVFVCNRNGLIEFAGALLTMVMSNQSVHKISPKPAAVKMVNEACG